MQTNMVQLRDIFFHLTALNILAETEDMKKEMGAK
jgi:hypothetical protein